jgi:hypothetical protein
MSKPKFAFTITAGHGFIPGDSSPSRVGWTFAWGVGRVRDAVPVTEGHAFRLYDDDGELCYEGIANRPFADLCEDMAFWPLDWATADVGATRLDYFDPTTGEWTML